MFVSPKKEAEEDFTSYLEVSRKMLTLSDVEFAYAFVEDFEKEIGNLGELVESNFYKRWGFSIRVYRRGNIADFKDMTSTINDFVDVCNLSRFHSISISLLAKKSIWQ